MTPVLKNPQPAPYALDEQNGIPYQLEFALVAKAQRVNQSPIHQVNQANQLWHRHSLAMLVAAACNAALLGVAGWSLQPAAVVVAAAPATVVAVNTIPAKEPIHIQASVTPATPNAPIETAQLVQVDKALKSAVPHAAVHPAHMAAVKKPGAALARLSEQQLLARVMWHEARGQGRLGMLATGIVTMNRLHEGHNGHTTLASVVNEPYAYTWVKNPQAEQFSADSLTGHIAMQVADRLLSNHLMIDEQALADKLGNANHFHAVTMAKYPGWTAGGKLERVKLTHAEEVALGAVFYAPRDVGVDVASR